MEFGNLNMVKHVLTVVENADHVLLVRTVFKMETKQVLTVEEPTVDHVLPCVQMVS
jgi:hypothetical protein